MTPPHGINYLEILAVLSSLQSFSDKVSTKHIKLMVDNTTAVATINQMGTCHSNLHTKLVQQIWEWYILLGVWLTVVPIPGKSIPDYLSDRVESIQRRALRIIYPEAESYDQSLRVAKLETLVSRRISLYQVYEQYQGIRIPSSIQITTKEI